MYRVYIADDEMWVAVGIKKLIEKSGLPFEVIGEANDGITALEQIEKMKPQVLFSDIRMPGFDGLTLLEKLAEKEIDLLVVYISGYAEFEYAQRACRLGAFDYLLKPVEQEKMNGVLQRMEEKLCEAEKEKRDLFQKEKSHSVIEKVILEIQNRYTENITLTDLAEEHGISISHLSAMIKAELNMSFSDYIAARRLQKAKELLRDEMLSVQQVAEQVGYQDYFYFTKVFKKNVGISPSKYRKTL